MKSLRSTLLSVTAVVAGLALSQGALAQSTWTLKTIGSGGGCKQNAANSGTYNNSWDCNGTTASGKTPAGTSGPVTISAWSSDRSSTVYEDSSGKTTIIESKFVNGRWRNVTRDLVAGDTGAISRGLTGSGYASAYLSPQSNLGFGAASRTEGADAQSPNHAFDSTSPGTQDVLLLSFASSVILDQIGIGWNNGPDTSDITLMRWTGTSAPGRTLGDPAVGGEENLSSAIASANTAGWELVGSYADLVAGTPRDTNADRTKGSSWWLISTFNTALNGGSLSCKNAAGGATTCDPGNDAFKLNFVATLNPQTPPPPEGGSVPEPGSMALAGIALAAVFGARKRKAQQA